MRKLWLSFILLAMLALAACGQGTPAAAPTATLEPSPEVEATGEATAVQYEASGPATCTVTSLIPTPDPTEAAIFPPITDEDWSEGEKDAALTLMVYTDFQCPYCGELDPVLDQLLQAYPEDVRIVTRHYPLSIHPNAPMASQASEAAGLQNKFFAMKQFLFANQEAWSTLSTADLESYLKDEAAPAAGLDVEQFMSDLKSDEVVKKVADATQSATEIGIPGTPFILVNGRTYQGPRDFFNLEAVVKLIGMEDKQFAECPPIAIDPEKQYTATIKTNKGDIVVDLYAKQAPFTVNSFIFLARQGWYDNVSFHRVLPNFVAQAGDPSGTGYGGPGYAYSNEVDPALRFDKPGVLGMANAGPDSNGSQFFITFNAVPTLDGQYTVFGQVVDGMDVLAKLQERDPSQGGENLPEGDVIQSIAIEEK